MNARRLGGFDGIAPVYDLLATIVFWGSIRKAQRCYLNEIPDGGRVLILGGGTGWLLVDLLRVNPKCEIWYIEASSRMIHIARSNISSAQTASINFVHGTQQQLPLHLKYDAVIANFYFDLFTGPTLEGLMNQIRNVILPNGKLLVSDFIKNNSWWQRAFLSLMYLFFRWICKIEATHLPDWHRQLSEGDWDHKVSRNFYCNFIRSSVYETGRGGVVERG